MGSGLTRSRIFACETCGLHERRRWPPLGIIDVERTRSERVGDERCRNRRPRRAHGVGAVGLRAGVLRALFLRERDEDGRISRCMCRRSSSMPATRAATSSCSRCRSPSSIRARARGPCSPSSSRSRTSTRGAPIKTKRYYSAFLGEHSQKDDETNRAFAPLSLAGRTTFSDTVRFYPIGNPLPKLVDDAGDYASRSSSRQAIPAHPDMIDSLLWREEPSRFLSRSTLPWISEEQLGHAPRKHPMHDKDWKPTDGAGKARWARPDDWADMDER